ncbi:unknown protein [Seminavis robusta]|uniref:Uncharacterized protein n=1 Tax=Seminavis robusta TaxID=568900 RepID=A0A9N8HYX2_9STRA|nr:unknown protein [Seminavis robusta]|eukprot:Sro2683_g334550.1 n/a (248) ;mRNA; f:7134-7877
MPFARTMADWVLASIFFLGRYVACFFLFLVRVCFHICWLILASFALDELNRIIIGYCCINPFEYQPTFEYPRAPTPPPPPPTPPRPTPPPPPATWVTAQDIDGLPCEELDGVSFRFKYRFHDDVEHVQGSLRVDRYGNTPMHRLWVDGHLSLPCPTGQKKRVKGDRYDYPILLPLGGTFVALDDLGASEKSQTKYFLLKVEFSGNADGLEVLQLIVPVRNSSERLSACLAFQKQLFRALKVAANTAG